MIIYILIPILLIGIILIVNIFSERKKYLEQAKSFGDVLILGLNSDSSIRTLKGDNRPINNQIDQKLLFNIATVNTQPLKTAKQQAIYLGKILSFICLSLNII